MDVLTIVITVATVTAGVIVWVYSMFETKESAKTEKKRVSEIINDLKKESEIQNSEIKELSGVIHKVAVDIAYIKGCLEPRNLEKN